MFVLDRRQKISYPHFTTTEFIEINNIATFLIVNKHQMRHNSSSGVANENDINNMNKEMTPIMKNSLNFKVELLSFKLKSKMSGNTLQIFERRKNALKSFDCTKCLLTSASASRQANTSSVRTLLLLKS